MNVVDVAIVGGGLSGLYAATLLEQHGIHSYRVLEARAAFGGRILSLPDNGDASSDSAARYDLGATWFWPELQPVMQSLLDELGLAAFRQHEDGDLLVQRSRSQPVNRVAGVASSPPGWRLAGGMAALTDALRHRLPARKLCACQRVIHLTCADDGIDVCIEDSQGQSSMLRAAQVLLALPPRLAIGTLGFTPALPQALAAAWQQCATWMAPHAKYLAVYERPFWREQGLSGEARSAVGPMAEVHDASPQAGAGALFGFIGIPAHVRRNIPEAVFLAACRAQLVGLFGQGAAAPTAEFLKDWSGEVFTAVAADQQPAAHQAASIAISAASGDWSERLIGIGSEWSPLYSGYAAGALDAAQRGVRQLVSARVANDG